MSKRLPSLLIQLDPPKRLHRFVSPADFVISSRPSISRNTHMSAFTKVSVTKGRYYQQIDIRRLKFSSTNTVSVSIRIIFIVCFVYTIVSM